MRYNANPGRNIILALSIVAVIAGVLYAQDPVKLNPGKYKVVFENDHVRLLEYQDKPGDVSVMHRHPPHLVYYLGPSKRKFTSPDGKTEITENKTSDTVWSEAVSHRGENIGTANDHVLIFELKESPKK